MQVKFERDLEHAVDMPVRCVPVRCVLGVSG